MTERAVVEVVVGLGSNLDPERNLPAAVRLLASGAEVGAVSHAWATRPVGPPGQRPFVNAAVLLRTRLAAAALRRELLRDVERKLGRVRSPDRYAARTVDLDLVLFGKVPEPDLLRYAHVALPASEVAPEWVHAKTGETLPAIAARIVGALAPEDRPRRLDLDLSAQLQKNEGPVDFSTGHSED